jgi:hypothetical protein
MTAVPVLECQLWQCKDISCDIVRMTAANMLGWQLWRCLDDDCDSDGMTAVMVLGWQQWQCLKANCSNVSTCYPPLPTCSWQIWKCEILWLKCMKVCVTDTMCMTAWPFWTSVTLVILQSMYTYRNICTAIMLQLRCCCLSNSESTVSGTLLTIFRAYVLHGIR